MTFVSPSGVVRLLAFAVALTLLWAPSARAAEISVEQIVGPENTARFKFKAAPSESNRVTVRIQGLEPGRITFEFRDAGAFLSPGPGCKGGGEPGSAVECSAPAPKWPDSVPCGKGCAMSVPGSAWRSVIVADLGDGNNSFDGGQVPEILGPSIAMEVSSGAGSDAIRTSVGEDRIDPGFGSDEVHSGPGFDRIKVTATADGPDLYDSGGSIDKVSYDLRSEPIHLAGSTAGVAGEGDTLLGRFYVIGGNTNDELAGGPEVYVLEGGPGDDLLTGSQTNGTKLFGGPGDDQLSTAGAGAESLNHLVGEGGNDTYQGGEGTDMIFENMRHSDWGARPEPSPTPESSGGNDVAHGEGKGDMISLGTGSDRAYGGPGDDEVTGESGADSIYGGPGRDQLVSGRTPLHVPNFVFPRAADDGRDRVDCGPGRDIGNVNPWDRRFRCETTHLLRRAATDR